MRNKTYTLLIPVWGAVILASCVQKNASVNGYVNNSVPGLHTNYPASEENLSEAMRRNNTYDSEYPMENELYTTFNPSLMVNLCFSLLLSILQFSFAPLCTTNFFLF